MMQSETFQVLNVKCGGCASNIQNGLTELEYIQQVEVDVATGQVKVTGDKLERQLISDKLSQLGYPEA